MIIVCHRTAVVVRHHTAVSNARWLVSFPQYYTYHFLENLAETGACETLVLLANRGDPDARDSVKELFRVLLSGVRPEHDEVRAQRVLAF